MPIAPNKYKIDLLKRTDSIYDIDFIDLETLFYYSFYLLGVSEYTTAYTYKKLAKYQVMSNQSYISSHIKHTHTHIKIMIYKHTIINM